MQQVLDFISNYTQITEEEIQAILGILNFSSHPKNEILQKQGAVSRRIAFMLKGAVRAYYRSEDGVEHTISFSFENSPMAEIENFSRQAPSSVEVITLEPTELIWIGYAEFFSFLEAHPKYESVLRSMMSHFLQLDTEQWRLLRINSARERYETLCKTRPDIIQRVPLKYIASYLEIAVETLSRVRAGKL